MKPSIINKLAGLSERLDELNRLLSTEDVTRDIDNDRKLTREHAGSRPLWNSYAITA